MSCVFNNYNAYKKIVVLVSAAETAARDPRNYLARVRLEAALADVSMDDILDAADDPELGRRFFTACQAVCQARNTSRLMAASSALSALCKARWRRGQARPRTPRTRADIYG